MTGPDPAEYGWWLASRAAGIVALVCIALSVGIGLAMAGRAPSRAHRLFALHQQTALIGLVAIAVHGITLLGDRFLAPSIGDIALPFTSTFAPLWTGLGVTGGWLAAILGLSYWIRDRIGTGLWRRLHRATILVYVLSVAPCDRRRHRCFGALDATAAGGHRRADPVPVRAARAHTAPPGPCSGATGSPRSPPKAAPCARSSSCRCAGGCPSTRPASS